MFESGQILQEHYQLRHLLGRSPQVRQTWLAVDLATDSHELVVIKLLVFTEMQWHDLKLFEREAQVLQNLEHSYIPRYRNYFLVNQQPDSPLCWWGLVQDYVPGKSFQDLLEQGHQFSEQEVRRIAKNILQILIYLHGLSPPILHRDIKPSNLILDQAQQVWMVDFGAVQNQASVTGVSFTVAGTVGYAPLEQFWGRATAASDLYALGATLIHLLTGVAPVDLPQRDLRIHFCDRVRTHSSFVYWVEKLTEPAIEKRFTSASEASKALEQETVSGGVRTVCTKLIKYQGNKPHGVKQIFEQLFVLSVCGSLLLFGGWQLFTVPDRYRDEFEFRSKALLTTGVVTEVERSTSCYGGVGLVPRQCTFRCSANVKFESNKGRIIKFWDNCEGKYSRLKKNQTVPVLYDPTVLDYHRVKARIDRGDAPESRARADLIASLCFVLFGAGLLVCFAFNYRSKQKQT